MLTAAELTASPMVDPKIPDFVAWKGFHEEEKDMRQQAKKSGKGTGRARGPSSNTAASRSMCHAPRKSRRLAIEDGEAFSPDDDMEEQEDEEFETDPVSDMIEQADRLAMLFLDEVDSAPAGPAAAAAPKAAASSSSGIVRPVPVPPTSPFVPATSEVRKPAESRKKEVTEQVLLLPGLGDIRYNPKSKALIAHCQQHGLHTCKRQRTVLRSEKVTLRNLGSGRPLGHLAAWLLEAPRHDTQAAHVLAPTAQDFSARKNGRDYLKKIEASGPFFEFERPKGDGSESEPEVVS